MRHPSRSDFLTDRVFKSFFSNSSGVCPGCRLIWLTLSTGSLLSGYITAGPCPLQIVTSAQTVHIQNFPCKIQAGDKTGFQIVCDFLRIDASSAYLGLLKGVGLRYLRRKMLYQTCKGTDLFHGPVSDRRGRVKMCQFQPQCGELFMKQADKEFFCCFLRTGSNPFFQKGQKLFFCKIRHKIQYCGY